MSESTLTVMQRYCRTCLFRSSAADMTSVYTLEPTLHVTYSAIIEAVTGLDISEDACKLEHYKMYLCSSCKKSATSAYEYKLMAIKADRQLRTGAVNDGVRDTYDEDKSTVKQYDHWCDVTESSAYSDDEIKHNAEIKQELECEDDNIMVELPCSPMKIDEGRTKEEPTHDAAECTHQCGICGMILDSFSSIEKHAAVCLKAQLDRESFSECLKPPDPVKTDCKPKKGSLRVSKRKVKNKPLKVMALGARRNPTTGCYVHRQCSYPRCGVCDLVPVTEGELLDHCSEKHYGTRVSLCPRCNKMFTQVKCMRRHLLVSHAQEEAAVATMLAQATSTTVESLVDNRSDSEELYLSVCPQCGELTVSSRALQQHNSTEHPAFTLICELCNKVFLYEGDFKIHKRPCYRRFAHRCGICKERFIHRRMMEIHAKSQHSDDPIVEETVKGKAWRCSVCDEIFKTNWSLLTHERLTHELHGKNALREWEKHFECDICHSIIMKKSSLVQHLKKHDLRGEQRPERKQSEPAPLPLCTICGESVQQLGQHLSRKHPVRTYSCKHCSKEFPRKDYLKSHQRVHTDDKPHTCSHCGKQFARLDALKCHVRIHTGEKPYACKHCGRKFTQGHDRRRHELRHTGEKPYNCTNCGEGFDKAKDLQKHREDCS